MSLQIGNAFQTIIGKDGTPLDSGFVYIGESGQNAEVYPVPIFYDENLTIPAPQPLRTINGYFSRNGSPAKIFISSSSCSIVVRDKLKNLQWIDLGYTGVLNQEIQDEIKRGIANRYDSALSYNIGDIVLLNNGTELISTVNNNTNDPNVSLTGWKPNNLFVTPQMFGAKGDGVYDDRPAFQAAIDYLRNNGGGTLFLPKPPIGYRFKSYSTADSACLVINAPLLSIYTDPICILGESNLTDIRVDLGSGVTIDSAILLKGGGLYKKFENLSIWGGIDQNTKNCNYVLKGFETSYPNMTIRDCRFYAANEDCLKIQTYVTVLDKVQTAYSKRGIVVDGGGNPQTSITLNSCYALNHTHNGYWFGQTTYCTFNSCAADHIINTTGDGYEAYPYYIDIARGVAINGCGAEASTRMLKVRSAQGLAINGLMSLSIGDNTNPPNNLIRIDGGYSTVISGLHLQNPLAYTYKLSLGNTFARECVVITDESIEPNEATYVAGAGREKPIVFLVNEKLKRTLSFNLTNTGNATTNTANMRTFAAYSYDRELNYTLTINLPSGDFPINDAVSLANAGTNGYARIILKGNADGTSRIVCTAAGSINFSLPSTLARINYTLENVTIHADTTINAGVRLVNIQNANVYFINSKLTSHNGAVQYASTSDSKIILDANSSIQTPAVSSGIVEYTYKATTPPTTSTRLPVWTVFKASDPNATRIGWINTADNGATWLPLNPS